jgi:hypothetical protein
VGLIVRKPAKSSISLEDAWQRRATAVAIEAARRLIEGDGAIPRGTPIGRLSDVEWGYFVAAILFGWISTRAEQATGEGLDTEQTIRLTGLDPEPWDAGVVMAILPELAANTGIDWSKPLADFDRDEMANFLCAALNLVRQGIAARDLGGKGITRLVTTPQPDTPNDDLPW